MAKKSASKRAMAKGKPTKPRKSKAPGAGKKDMGPLTEDMMDSEGEKNFAMAHNIYAEALASASRERMNEAPAKESSECAVESSNVRISALDSEASMSARIDSFERERLLDELLDEISTYHRRPYELSHGGLPDYLKIEQTVEALRAAVAERDARIDRLRMHLYRALSSPTLPDESGEIRSMLRRAPTAWHIRTVVEQAIQVLLDHARRGGREKPAMNCLGEIAKLFRIGRTKKRTSNKESKLQKAFAHPAFVEAFNKRPPKRTRGGTGGNNSIQVIFTWTEFAIGAFDKSHNPNYRPEIYADTDGYMKLFLAYAKTRWETEGGPEPAEIALGRGMKARTNVGRKDVKPKQSFGLFKDEIEANARRILNGWLERYAPNVRRGYHQDADQT